MTEGRKELSFPNNVVNSTGGPLVPGPDSLFLNRLFEALQEALQAEFSRFTFVVHHRRHGELPGRPIQLDPGGPERVLILLADECEVFPVGNYRSYRAIFRSYGSPSGGDSGIYPFPVEYLDAAGAADSVPFAQRHHPVFFSGNLNSSRVDFYKQFASIPWLPRRNLPSRRLRELARRAIVRFSKQRNFDDAFEGSIIRFTQQFGAGFEAAEYARILSHTKIALCPPGFVSHETIRHWEAMRLGCIVISAPLPPNRFYLGSPIIQLKDWSQLVPILGKLLADPEEMHNLHVATHDWWKRVSSECATAKWMAQVLCHSQQKICFNPDKLKYESQKIC